MDLLLRWHHPVTLHDGQADGLIYAIRNFDPIPVAPGIYVFTRQFGGTSIPLYVGQATNLRSRVGGQLNNLRLMRAIEDEPNGGRLVLIGEWIPKRGQREGRALNALERAYIENALTEGHQLLNVQGTRTPIDTITSEGRRRSHQPFPRRMNVKRGR